MSSFPSLATGCVWGEPGTESETLSQNKCKGLGIVLHTFIPSTQETERDRISEFQANQVYRRRPCLQKKTTWTRNTDYTSENM